MYLREVKPFIDASFALVAFLILLPLFCVITVLLWWFNGGKAYFLQERIGKKGQRFTIIKFKTMTDQRDVKGALLPDEARVTRLGAFLRETSLDELPQLINVLKGDMSLVGPRPWIPKEFSILTPREQCYRGRVKPGITGLAQICGRNDLSFQKRFEYDAWYIQHVSSSVDFRILWRTVIKVIMREGVHKSANLFDLEK